MYNGSGRGTRTYIGKNNNHFNDNVMFNLVLNTHKSNE